MADKKAPKKYEVDVDTTDAFLDYPDLRYDDGVELTSEMIKEQIRRHQRGEITLPEKPSPLDD